ncbi:BQ2448_3495 [Microbotryum intermedium]|uniref:BQ2448_3495 protein n=1 Tax=Microbotryum intermedium TaxID=269621 RepID=A0A238FFF2_9BASI|nr:BQ2448_3495 [Microbotryum intermedium]
MHTAIGIVPTNFEFSSPFDFGFFPSTSAHPTGLDSLTTLPQEHRYHHHAAAAGGNHAESSSAASLLGVSGLSSHSNLFNSNPFSPQNLASPPSHFSSLTSPPSTAAPSTSSNALFATSSSSSSSSLPPHRPFPSSAPHHPTPSLNAPHPSTSLNPSPLFDDSESALLSSFLTTLDVDPFFLFNPVLPPGMPSPPPSFPLDEQAQSERDRLGAGLGKIKLEKEGGWGKWAKRVEAAAAEGGGQDGPDVEEEEQHDELEEDDEDSTPKDRASSSGVVVGTGGKRASGNLGAGQRGRGGLTKGKKARRVSMHESAEDVEMGEVTVASSTMTAPSRGARSARSMKGSAAGTSSGRLSSGTKSKDTGRSITPLGAPSAGRDERPATEEATKEGGDEQRPQEAEEAEEDEEEEEDDNDDDSKNNGKAPLTDTQKRSNHIASEQKRRNAIRSGFKDLVDLLAAGETASGIVVAPPEPEGGNDASGNGGKKKRASKGTGRGRGRKGEVAAGGSKSVVLEKAAAYILWLERGNQALAAEVQRMEVNMRQIGIGTV